MSILERLKSDNDVASYCYKDGYQISYSSIYGYYLFKTRNFKRSSPCHNISNELANKISEYDKQCA